MERKDGEEYRARFKTMFFEQARLHRARCLDPMVCVDEPRDTARWQGCNSHILDATFRSMDMIDATAYALQPRYSEEKE